MPTDQEPQVFLGLDVGKTEHWACAVTRDRQIIWNKTLPNDEQQLVKVFTSLQRRGACRLPAISGRPFIEAYKRR